MSGAKNVFIVAAKRTAIGTFGGKLAGLSATKLGVEATKAALAAGKISPDAVSSVIIGNVIQSSVDAAYLARHVALGAGMPISTPGLTVNRLCGSGFQALIQGHNEITLGESEIVVTGGAENMSQCPFAVRNIRFGTRLGTDIKLEDTLWEGLRDTYSGLPMGMTAEKLAEKYGVTRKECDEWAIESNQRWAKAHKAGHFDAEITPVMIKGKKGSEEFKVDEHPKVEATLEKIAKLPTVFKKDGTVTAANASGINDGAAVVVVASESAVKQHGLTPLARVISYASVGVPPEIMGIGPVPAIQAALKNAGLQLSDMDLVEINEAFAPQFLACHKELKLDLAKTNVAGGAIAIGHPLAASGARIMAHLAHTLQRTGGRYAIGSACIGGGMGTAVVIERC